MADLQDGTNKSVASHKGHKRRQQRFTDDEVEKLRRTMKNYCALHQISERELFDGYLHHKDLPCLKRAWHEIAQEFPSFNMTQVKTRGKYILHPFKRGPWSEEEIDRLLFLVHTHGNKWVQIEGLMDRYRADCIDKYHYNQSKNKDTGEWSMDEVKEFKKMVTEFLKMDHEKTDFPDLLQEVERRDITLPFTAFSVKMKHKRTRKQIGKFWSKMEAKINENAMYLNNARDASTLSSENVTRITSSATIPAIATSSKILPKQTQDVYKKVSTKDSTDVASDAQTAEVISSESLPNAEKGSEELQPMDVESSPQQVRSQMNIDDVPGKETTIESTLSQESSKDLPKSKEDYRKFAWKVNSSGDHPRYRFRCTRFSAYEKYRLMSTINKYCEKNKVTTSYLFDPSNENLPAWKEIAKGFHNRTIRDIYRKSVKTLNPHKHGPWKKDEVKRLFFLVKEYDCKWNIVHKFLNRSAHDCAQKYREINDKQAAKYKKKVRRLPKAVKQQLRQVSKSYRPLMSDSLKEDWYKNAAGKLCPPAPNRGRFTKSDVKTLENAINQCCDSMKISKSTLLLSFNNYTNANILGKAWRTIAESFPDRSVLSVYLKCLKLLGPKCKRGQWSTGEHAELRSLVERHGKNWQMIQKEMNRSSASCSCRYKKMTSYKESSTEQIALSSKSSESKIKTGVWHPEETDVLITLIKQHLGIDDPGYEIVDIVEYMREEDITFLPFSDFSKCEKLNRTRSQCKNFWKAMEKKSEVLLKARKEHEKEKKLKEKEKKKKQKEEKKKKKKAKKKKRKKEKYENSDDIEQQSAKKKKKGEIF